MKSPAPISPEDEGNSTLLDCLVDFLAFFTLLQCSLHFPLTIIKMMQDSEGVQVFVKFGIRTRQLFLITIELTYNYKELSFYKAASISTLSTAAIFVPVLKSDIDCEMPKRFGSSQSWVKSDQANW